MGTVGWEWVQSWVGSRTHHFGKFFLRFSHSLAIVAIDDEDESLCVLEIVAPERSDLVLAAYVPNCEADVLVFHRLHVEPYKI